MSEELENLDELDFQTDTLELPKIPHSWMSVFAGYTAFGFVMTAAVLSILQYTASRPFDLLSLSEQTARSLENFLTSHNIPPDLISVSNPTLYEESEAHYYLHEYSVQLPKSVDPDALERMLNQQMRRNELNVSDFIDGGVKKGVIVSYGEFVFANVRLLSVNEAPNYDALGPPPSKPRDSAASDINLPTVQLPIINKAALPSPPESDKSPEDSLATSAPPAAPPQPKKATYSGWVPANREAPMPQNATNVADDIELARVPSQEASNPALIEPKQAVLPTTVAKLAIIVDDEGYGGALTETILSLSPKLTLSILPNTPLGTEIAELGFEKGFEIMLHMPMENTYDGLRHPGQLNTNMSEREITHATKDALKQIPHAIGINNHTGSKFTANAKAMALFIDTIKALNLYFVDSKTTPDTRAYEISKAFGLASAERDLFIDHDNAVKEIRRRFKEVVSIAKANGQAIAIRHFRPNTASVLGELLSTLEAEGITLVHASELVQ